MRTILKAIFVGLISIGLSHLVCGATELIRITPSNYDQVVPAGKEVDAIVGDYVLRNDQVVVVIAQPGDWRHANLTIRNIGGAVLDFTERDRPNDQLGVYLPLATRYVYHYGIDSEKVGWVRATVDGADAEVRTDLNGSEIAFQLRSNGARDGSFCEMTYRLSDGSPVLEIESLVHNPSGEAVEVALRDSIRADKTFSDGVDAAGENGSDEVLWFADRWFPQAYAAWSPGRQPKKSGNNLVIDWTADESSTITLGSKETYRLVRYLTVAPHRLALRPRLIESLSALASKEESSNTGTPVESHALSVSVHDSWGPVSGALAKLSSGERVWGEGVSDAAGELVTAAPAGEWLLTVSAIGRATLEQRVTLPLVNTAAESSTEPLALTMESCGRVSLTATNTDNEPLPFKASFHGIEGTSNPDFGPESLAWSSGNVCYGALDPVTQDLSPGKYEVVISHGPEHDAVVETIEVRAGEVTELKVELEHVVDTTGWISSDFHSHSSPSGDNTSDQLGRVLNLLAENIEFAPCTEHARIDSYLPHLDLLRAHDWMATCSGMELTGGPLPVNHQNAFPLIFRPHTQNGGGPETDVNPIVQIERLAMWDDGSEKLVQQNHPNLRQIYGDLNADSLPDPGLKEMFGFMDVIEVHPPQSIFATPASDQKPDDREPVMFHWMQLLNLGYRIPGVVNTDAHYNLHGSGWLRNYVRSGSDRPSRIDVSEIVRNCEAGRIVMSTGPYLEVVAQSGTRTAIPGEDLEAVEGQVELWVRVQCPNWIDINRVQIFVNGRPHDELGWRRRTHEDAFGNEVVKFEKRIPINLDRDAHLIVATIGEELALGRVMGGTFGKQPPVAVANPIFVDVDGDGFEANQDQLDHPLPVIAR